jgi:Flp pilus assembly protein TadG
MIFGRRVNLLETAVRVTRCSEKRCSGTRAKRGALIVEFASSLFLFTFFVILSVHIGVIIYGAFLNDAACRDATRAAAQGKTIAQATQLAQTILRSHRQSNSFLTSPVMQTPIVYQDFGGAPPNAQTSPYVQITTTTQVNLPFPAINFLTNLFTADQRLRFRQTYTFPIVRVN